MRKQRLEQAIEERRTEERRRQAAASEVTATTPETGGTAARPEATSESAPETERETAREAEREAAPAPELPPLPRAPRPKPIDSTHYKLQLTIDAETYDELMRLRALVRHSVPDGDIAKVISHAIKAQRKAVAKRKLGRTDKPRQPSSPSSLPSRPGSVGPASALPTARVPPKLRPGVRSPSATATAAAT